MPTDRERLAFALWKVANLSLPPENWKNIINPPDAGWKHIHKHWLDRADSVIEFVAEYPV